MEITTLGDGVVVGDGEEIEPGLLGGCVQKLGRAARVGMEGVAVEVALVPASAGTDGEGAGRLGFQLARGGVEGGRDCCFGAGFGDFVEAENDVPASRLDVAVDIAGGRVVGGDEKAVAGATAPAAKTLRR